MECPEVPYPPVPLSSKSEERDDTAREAKVLRGKADKAIGNRTATALSESDLWQGSISPLLPLGLTTLLVSDEVLVLYSLS